MYRPSSPHELCNNPADRDCSNCGVELCWLHIKQKCRQGQKTRFGTSQHLTAHQKEELTLVTGLRLGRVTTTQIPGPENSLYGITIHIKYTTQNKKENILIVHLGMIQDTQENEWTPDEELRLWLTSRNIKHNQRWYRKGDAVRTIANAITTSTPAVSSPASTGPRTTR